MGWKMAKGTHDYGATESARFAMGLQGLLGGTAVGFATAGPLGAGMGAVVGGLGGIFVADANWDEKASQKTLGEVKQALEQFPTENATPRQKVARHVRAAVVGSRSHREEAYRIGYQKGAGGIEGLQKGLAKIPEVLTRKVGLEEPSTPRGVLKTLIGLPLGLTASVGSTLAGGLAGMSRHGSLGDGLVASTVLGGASVGVAALLGASAATLTTVALVGVAAPLAAVVLGVASLVSNGKESMGEHYIQRQYQDRALAPDYQDFSQERDQVANRRQARIEGFTAGLRNGALAGFEGGGRVTDRVIDGAERLVNRGIEAIKNLPEKLQGVLDGFKEPEK
jgi:hypothetical protein